MVENQVIRSQVQGKRQQEMEKRAHWLQALRVLTPLQWGMDPGSLVPLGSINKKH